MKKTIALLTMLSASAALASAVTSDTTFGVLKITSPYTETIISVPWVEAGSSGETETISVTNFVKTANLSAGDQLLAYYPADESYGAWVLTAKGGYWNAANATYNGEIRPAGASDATLTRGMALILVRSSVSDQDIYLYGQYKAPASLSITKVAGKTTLFAPINTSATGFDLNGYTWTGAAVGDQIKLQGAIPLVFTYYYDESNSSYKWGRKISTGWTTLGATIRAGEGAWYIPVASGTVTVTAK